MDIFDVLTMAGGLSLFLFGMSIMGQALERRAGEKLRSLLGKLTTNKLAGLLTGLVITAAIQSSSAATVMVVGFVNSGLMTLEQATHVIMGANVGTTVTAWILSLAGIDSGNLFVELLKPSSFTPVLALVGIVFYMFCKDDKKNDEGMILLGFATLMFGMETMSGAVSGLRDVPAFRELFVMFQTPVLGVLAGALLTAIIQSSSASVGILQALAVTGQVSYGAAVPIIMGQNIGTCVTAMFSAIGANKNAKRAATVHLFFNIIGTAVWLSVFCLVRVLLAPAFLDQPASLLGIAVAHSVFNVLCTILLLPASDLLEKLADRMILEAKGSEARPELDERLLATPPIALKCCREVTADMARISVRALKDSLLALRGYTPELAASIREKEEQTDRYEDMLGTYLVRLSAKQISGADNAEAAMLLKDIGDFERIADHAVNLLRSAKELDEVLDLSLTAFLENDLGAALKVEPLEQVIDKLKEQMRTRHILRLQQGACTIDAGFIWADLLTDLERTSDHCSNISGSIIDMAQHNMNTHQALRSMKNDSGDFRQRFEAYTAKYALL